MSKTVLIIVLLAFSVPAVMLGQSPGDTVYPKSDGTEIKDGTSFRSATIESADRDDPLEVLELDRTRLRVKTAAGNEGYVSKLRVTDEKPRSGRGGFGLSSDLSPEERENISSIRGLSPMAEEYAQEGSGTEAAKQQADRMLQISNGIDDEDVARFRQEGGIVPQ